ncbi:MAG: GTPase HflX [Geminicoccaceae bacterium]
MEHPPLRKPDTREGPQKRDRSRACVLHPILGQADGSFSAEARLDEAVGLAAAIDLDVVSAWSVPVRTPRPATLVGSGTLEELTRTVAAQDATVVIIDHPLSAIQQRNLERELKCKVIDRTGLILEIFGARANTREGVLQVELAALSYQRSRLVRSWTHLERQRGGLGFIGGPGESQLEIDRRRIDERIVNLKASLQDVRRTRGLHRRSRERIPLPTIALVGYTNAGKSTWFNRLTGAGVVAKNQLFATLDPTIRKLKLPTREEVAVSDTVGFVSNLPTQLVEAFRATLEEVTTARLIVHVRDASSPAFVHQASDVYDVLTSLGIGDEDQGQRVIELWNKADLLSDDDLSELVPATHPLPVVLGSAVTGLGEAELLDAIAKKLDQDRHHLRIELDASLGEATAEIFRRSTVVATEHRDGRLIMDVAVEPDQLQRLQALAERHDMVMAAAPQMMTLPTPRSILPGQASSLARSQ